jgi:hypothetical protein
MSYIPDRKLIKWSLLLDEAKEKFEQVAAERDKLRADLAAARNAYEMQRQDCINLTEKVIPNIRADLAAARALLLWIRNNGATWSIQTRIDAALKEGK